MTVNRRQDSVIDMPVHENPPVVEIDLIDVNTANVRNESLAIALDDEDVVRAGIEQLHDATEFRAFPIGDLQSDEVVPVILTGFVRWQQFPHDANVATNSRNRRVAVGNVFKTGDDAVALPAALGNGMAAPSGGRCNIPAPISEDIVTRARVGVNFDPAAGTENPADSTENNAVGIRHDGVDTAYLAAGPAVRARSSATTRRGTGILPVGSPAGAVALGQRVSTYATPRKCLRSGRRRRSVLFNELLDAW